MLIAGACTISPPVTDPTGRVITPPMVGGTGLARAIAEAMMAPAVVGVTTEGALQQFCNLLAAAIIEHLITNGVVSVSVSAGIPVATAGSAAAQTGATTGPGAGTGTLS